MALKVEFNRKMALLALALAGLVVVACNPRVLEEGGETLNPIEILNNSPRIYEIGFKDFGDSIETSRASSYFAGELELAMFPTERVETALGDSTAVRNLSPREVAEVEYIKARRRWDAGAEGAAAFHLKQAMSTDPTYRPPYLLLGEMLLARKAVEQACDVFGKVLEQDSTDADALVGIARCHTMMGRVTDARQALVDAVIYDRVNLRAWDLLAAVADFEECRLANHDAPELGMVRKLRGRHYKLLIDGSLKDCPVQATAWIAYASERAVWRYENKYKYYFGTAKYEPTYEEDIDCYMVLAAAWRTLAQPDSAGCDPAYLDYLSEVAENGQLVSHVLFDYVCIKAPGAARYFTAEVIAGLRDYVNTYIIVPKS